MTKVTYLFGAGASKNALPIVDEIPDRIKGLIYRLENDEFKLDDSTYYENLKISKTKRALQLEMIESLKWMMKASANHASVDTFAKKLYIKESYTELNRLKIALSVFFVFEQIINKTDLRYDTFFASLLSVPNEFPKNVRILSWNYDSQFELSFAEYSDNYSISHNQKRLRVNIKNGNYGSNIGFGIDKINGTAGFYSDSGHSHYFYADDLSGVLDLTIIDKVTRNYGAASYVNKVSPSLSFSWEKEYYERNIVTSAIENIKDTVALVVIGYSFPFFNREVDREIIGSMTNLKRVYFQAPDAEVLKERFEAIRSDLEGVELVVKHDVGQFLLPNEL